MEKNLLLILVGNRSANIHDIQKILTEYGCIIKTRLGIHDGVLDKCSDSGLIILELVGDKVEMNKMQKALQRYDKIETKLVSMALK